MKKTFRTTFQEELIKEMKKLAIELDCDVNEILEVSYKYTRDQKQLENLLRNRMK